jgi:hypothetical protein
MRAHPGDDDDEQHVKVSLHQPEEEAMRTRILIVDHDPR